MKTKKFSSGASCISLRRGKTLLRCLPILGMLFATTSAKAADSPGVKFNSGVRYSQWAIDSRIYNFKLNTNDFGLAKYDASGNKLGERTDSKGKLDYVGGLVSKATIEAADYYENYDWTKPWFYSVKEYGDNYKLSSKLSAGTAFDDMNGAKLYIGIYNNSNATDADKKNVTSALALIKTGFTTANKSYVIASGSLAEQQGNNVAGGWWHKKSYPNTMWCDGAYMGSALLAQLTAHYGTSDNVFGSKEADWNMVFKQLNIVWNMCWNSTDKLMYHGFDATASAGWAGLSATAPYVFHSAAYWGRANAWYLMSLVDVLEAMDKDGQNGTDNYNTLKLHLADLAAGVVARQDATTGGWYQLMNLNNTFTSAKGNANYIETSATSIFSAALFKAVRLGYLDASYKEAAAKAFVGLVNNFVTLDNGNIQIWGSSKSAGLDSSRKGDNNYYLDCSDVVMVNKGETTEGKVLGGFIMAATEYERAYQNQDSKQILFAKDLAPEYDFSTNGRSLDATAYGSGTVSYQWYKADGTKVADATSATFAPTEDGEYYCTATADGTSITTSTANVKANTSSAGGDDTPTTGTTIFSYTMPTSGSASTTDIDATVGKISFNGTSTFETNGFKFGANGTYVKVTPTSALQAGDVITFTSYAAKANMGIKANASADNSNAVTLGTGSTANQDYTGSYTVTANDVLNGATSIYLYRSSGSTTYLKSITITRASSSEPTTTQYTVTATANPAEGGTVVIKNGDNTVTSGSKVDEKTSVTFTATAKDGYEFSGWTVNNAAKGTDATYAVASLAENTTVVANFKKESETPVTPAAGSASFTTTDLKTLDSAPAESSDEKATLTVNNITIEAGTNINAGSSSSGLKVESNNNGSFYIKAINGAKIKTVKLTTNSSSKSLTFDPAVTPTNSSKVWTYDCSSVLPTSITVTNGTTSNISVATIEVEYETTAIEKKDFVATFTPATIDATEGDASFGLPVLKITAGDEEIAADNYTLGEYTSTDENVAKVQNGKVVFVGKGNADIKVVVTPKDATLYNGCVASFKVNVAEKTTPVDPTQPVVVYDFNTTVGTTTPHAVGVKVDGTTKLTFGSDFKAAEGKFITITAKDNGGFKVGDIITLKGYCDSKNKSGIEVRSVAADASIFKTNALAKFTEGGSEYTYTLTADCDSLCFGRFGGGNVYLTYLQVVRPASSAEKTRLTASFAKTSDVVINENATVALPKLTVMAGDTELTNGQYTVEYKSNAETVAIVENENINIKGEGTATITATVKPIDTANYEGCTATYQLTVKNPTELAISVQDVIMNVTDVEIKQPEIRVYGDDDKLLKAGEDYTLTYTTAGDQNVSVDAAGVFSVSGKSYAWTKGVTTITVTATPTEALGNTYKAGSITFTYSVTQGKRTAVFMQSFSGSKINLHQDSNTREFTVPLIYNNQDVSEAFYYKYYIGNDTVPVKKETYKVGKKTYTRLTHTMQYVPSTAGTFEVRVTATPKKGTQADGSDAYDEIYNTPADITFTLNVDSKFIIPVISLDPETVYMAVGNTEGAPDVTVTKKDDGTVLDESEYDVTWNTNDVYYVRVNAATGRLEAVSEGQAKGRCLVKGDNIESVTRFFDIIIDDPAKYSVKKSGETYGNQRVMWNQNKTMSVTLGGWMFPKDVATSGTTDEGLKNSFKWSDNSSNTSYDINGVSYFVDSRSSKNARQENGSNARPESVNLYNATYDKQGTIVDPMFNVPCSGSYLVFNPRTNGKVSVSIFQNGVFAKDSGKMQYRPQRRVFVMDEAGNIVNSKGVIGNANGKPRSTTLSDYTWDLGDKPTIDMVNDHFVGLNDFEMSAEGFKNNLYRSNLKTDKIINEAVDNHSDMDAAWGWCVLADAPVEYSFRVQAGKTYYLYNYGSKIGFYGFTFDEDATAPVVDEISYDENSANNDIVATEAGHVAKVSVNRSLKAGQWSALVLPFSLNKPQVDAIFGAAYSIGNTDGTQILYFDRIEGSKAIFVRHAYNTVVAGKPFLIKPTKDVESINTADCAEFPYVTIENTKPAEWCKGDGYAWVSSYNKDMTVKAGDCFISGSKGEFMNYTGSDSPMPGFRGYLKRTDYGVQEIKQLRAATGSYVADDSTSAIDGIYLDSDGNAAVEAIADGKVYNMSGQVVATSAAALKTLPGGVYMLNGKKIVK